MIPIRQYQVLVLQPGYPFWQLAYWGNGLDAAVHVKCLLLNESGVKVTAHTYTNWRDTNDPQFRYLLN